MSSTAHLSLVPDADPAAATPRQVEREHRYSVLLTGSIRKANAGNRMPIKIRNISSGGMMCECAYPPRVDDLVEIELPRLGHVAGHIRWGAKGRLGIAFDGPIDPTLAWVKAEKSEVLFDLPPMDTRRPGVVAAH
ncbi:PilZ domain-containing protein [Sphingomonas sp. CGMCC 1.13654]|uniref:PilZ domain-containing protein n=1 Tax=Sphingomonas chungangi TaxID=2683589 RepID=A0A838L7H1_9SPHN|nr:PilZ domain-containing protein [Sphingomonas chungangi]MBA2934967.1 PilZ domain-containing protein [Sphingomonas chungangi]